MTWKPSPPDNPLMGMVPYVTSDSVDRFPHSLEFKYFALSELMTGPETFDWSPVEETLKTTSARGCQLVTRIFIEYPGQNGIPQFLVDGGLKVTEWESDNATSLTPDYQDPNLRKAIKSFIAAFAAKYDNDPRMGFLTAGLLGSWGEWHNYPRTDLFASREVQQEVLDALAENFKTLPVLLRYPAGEDHYAYVKNIDHPFGYHDDSFGWATLDTGKAEDNWFFMPLLKAAGGLDKWKTHPIGGEFRPELWNTSFTDEKHPKEQDFDECVKQTHVSWLMDSGLFEKRFPMNEERKQRAVSSVSKMGYSFHIPKWSLKGNEIEITIENRGVAPIYRDWLVYIDKTPASFNLKGILPGETRIWKTTIPGFPKGAILSLHAPNPMPGGKPLRFANETQGEVFLKLGAVK